MSLRRLLLVAGLLLLVGGCDHLSGPFSVSIGKVLANPRDYEGKTITLSGTVNEVLSLIVIKAFLLSDNTGQIYVLTERILPRQGERVHVKGCVVEAFSLGNQTLTVFKEESPQQR